MTIRPPPWFLWIIAGNGVLVAAAGLVVIFPSEELEPYECRSWGLRLGRCITQAEAWPWETGLGLVVLGGAAGLVAYRWRDILMGP